jgi:hypothetical protein
MDPRADPRYPLLPVTRITAAYTTEQYQAEQRRIAAAAAQQKTKKAVRGAPAAMAADIARMMGNAAADNTGTSAAMNENSAAAGGAGASAAPVIPNINPHLAALSQYPHYNYPTMPMGYLAAANLLRNPEKMAAYEQWLAAAQGAGSAKGKEMGGGARRSHKRRASRRKAVRMSRASHKRRASRRR